MMKNNDKLRILIVNGGIMDFGGISVFIMNYLRRINKSLFDIELLVHGTEKGVFDDELTNMGIKIHRVTQRRKGLLKNYKEIKRVLKYGDFDIVHSNLDSMNSYLLRIAKKMKIHTRIAHSHNTKYLTRNPFKIILNIFLKKTISMYATDYAACSKEASIWLFGKGITSNKITIINNAIEYENFFFDYTSRDIMRSKLGLNENFVIGHIGRFDYQKNHSFLIDIFKVIHENNSSAKLLLIGDGHLHDQIINKIKSMNLMDNIILLGYVSDPEKYLNAMDLFVFPSLFEGLGISVVEAQVNGLECIVSDSVPKQTKISNRISYLSLNDKLIWVEKIMLSISKGDYSRDDTVSQIYSIDNNVLELERYYMESSRRNLS